MKYLAYSGNSLVNVSLPEGSEVLYAPPPLPGIPRRDLAGQVARAYAEPLGMPPLRELVDGRSRVLIVFDDNCQPFPATSRPDFRQVALETLLRELEACGVSKERIRLLCAVALHRKMKPFELAAMVGRRVMSEFYPRQLENFDAEDREGLVDLGRTVEGEVVEISRHAAEADLVLYVDTVQIPLNGGHKAVSVGLGSYRTIAAHHSPAMTAESPHVMQPDGSLMHACIERMGRVVEERCRIMTLEASMNSAVYPPHLAFLGKPAERCNGLERALRRWTPALLAPLPEPLRCRIFRGLRTAYEPMEIHAGRVDEVHRKTLEALERQIRVPVSRQYDTLVFGLPDISPYAVGARINPVLVLSDVLGYVFNWFYGRPLVRKGGTVIILNPVLEHFHPEYHLPYRRFWDEVLPATTDPFEMQERFQEDFATDPELIRCYRERYAHHGFHPFTVWYWATYPLRYLSRVILVGPPDDRTARRLGVSWAPDLARALAMGREAGGGDTVAALTIPPFFYVSGA